ncbi:MAG: hypothetical protein JXA13_03330, partial [Anaerolineales bacterium]|nr:hypothetical protein [Anaerolineales bacterium]
MNRSIVYRILMGLAALLVLAVVGFFAFKAGVGYNLAQEGLLAERITEAAVYPAYHYSHPHFYRPMTGLGCLVPIGLFFLFMFFLRGMFWGPWYWGRHWYMRHHSPGGWEKGVPPF